MRMGIVLGSLVLALSLQASAPAGDLLSVEQELVCVVESSADSVVAVSAIVDAQPADSTASAVRMRYSGIVWDARGYVLTTADALVAADRLEVTLSDGRALPAERAGLDFVTNVGLLKVNAQGLKAAAPGDSRALKRGAFAVVVGNAFGLRGSISLGVVSGLGRGLEAAGHVHQDMIQLTAPVNPGDIGGAVVNSRGEVVGMVAASFARAPSASCVRSWLEGCRPQEDTGLGPFNPAVSSMAAEGIGFAIPTHVLQPIAAELIRHGCVERPWLGVLAVELPPELRRTPAGRPLEGVFVLRVVPESPAAKAGILPRDVIVAFDGEGVRSLGELTNLVQASKAGRRVVVRARRQDQDRSFEVQLIRRSDQQPPRHAVLRGDEMVQDLREMLRLRPWLGIYGVQRPAPADAPTSGVEVLAVAGGSPAAQAGLRVGDLIVEFDGAQVAGFEVLRRLVLSHRPADTVRVKILRSGVGVDVDARLAPPGFAAERGEAAASKAREFFEKFQQEVSEQRQRSAAGAGGTTTREDLLRRIGVEQDRQRPGSRPQEREGVI